ncbi:MAG TPA: RNA chaperone Hfq [Alphaproteobacteria bacterium]|nr:RNA chaperone Hfq [Alphaproteobacteria bacterium]
MKALDSPAPQSALDRSEQDFTNRKLIRPSLSSSARKPEAGTERRERTDRFPAAAPRNMTTPEKTHAENFYYQKQIQSKTPVAIVLKDGAQLQGVIEWYDRNCIKVDCKGSSGVLIYKSAIRYIYKAGESLRS